MRSTPLYGLALGLGLALVLGIASAAPATVFPLASTLDGAQETPPVVTTGTGSATLSFDDSSGVLSWTISFSSLVGTLTDAHFHGPAPVGTAAGVQIGIPNTPGVTSGTLIGSAALSAPQAADLLAGLWYINIHTTFAPGGELRGQVVPEPAAGVLLGAGLLGLGVGVARRRSR